MVAFSDSYFQKPQIVRCKKNKKHIFNSLIAENGECPECRASGRLFNLKKKKQSKTA